MIFSCMSGDVQHGCRADSTASQPWTHASDLLCWDGRRGRKHVSRAWAPLRPCEGVCLRVAAGSAAVGGMAARPCVRPVSLHVFISYAYWQPPMPIWHRRCRYMSDNQLHQGRKRSYNHASTAGGGRDECISPLVKCPGRSVFCALGGAVLGARVGPCKPGLNH